MTNASAFRGTGTAIVTPMFENQEVDFQGLGRLVEYIIEGGVEYLVVLGTTGESATLSSEEKAQVIRKVQEVAGNRVPIVLGCGGNDTKKVRKEIKEYAETFNPDAFLSVSPYYNKPSQNGIFRHFSAVAEASPLPVILYNVPGRTSSNMLPSTVVKLARRHSNLIAIKEASGNVEQGIELLRTKPSHFSVLSGDDTLAFAQIAAGFDGVISVAANAIPKQFSGMIRNALAGNLEKGRAELYQIFHLMNLHFAEGNPAGVKGSLAELGVCEPWTRLPLVEASSGLRSQLHSELRSLGLVNR